MDGDYFQLFMCFRQLEGVYGEAYQCTTRRHGCNLNGPRRRGEVPDLCSHTDNMAGLAVQLKSLPVKVWPLHLQLQRTISSP